MPTYSILPTDTSWTLLIAGIKANSVVQVASVTGYVNWDPLGSGHVSPAEGTYKINDPNGHGYAPSEVSGYSDFPLSLLTDWPVQDQVPLAPFLYFVATGSSAPSFGTMGSYRPNRGPFYADQRGMAQQAGTHDIYDLYGIFNDINSGNSGPGYSLTINVTNPSGGLIALPGHVTQGDIDTSGICSFSGLLVPGNRLRNVDGRMLADRFADRKRPGPRDG